MLLDRNNRSLNIANVISDNDYQITFDIPTEIGIQNDVEDILKNKKNPTNNTSSLCSTSIISSRRNRD